MIRLRVVYGGRRVGQVLPSYQNRQISALDETADAPQSSLFSLLSFLFVSSSLRLFVSSFLLLFCSCALLLFFPSSLLVKMLVTDGALFQRLGLEPNQDSHHGLVHVKMESSVQVLRLTTDKGATAAQKNKWRQGCIVYHTVHTPLRIWPCLGQDSLPLSNISTLQGEAVSFTGEHVHLQIRSRPISGLCDWNERHWDDLSFRCTSLHNDLMGAQSCKSVVRSCPLLVDDFAQTGDTFDAIGFRHHAVPEVLPLVTLCPRQQRSARQTSPASCHARFFAKSRGGTGP